jgi:hypothetical protein
VLVVVRIQRIRDENFDWSCGVTVQAIHQYRVENRTLIDEVWLASG